MSDDAIRVEIEKVVGRLRPAVEAEGGGIKLMEVQDGIVTVGVVHTCSCPSTRMLQEFGIVEALKKVSGVKEVKTITS